MSRILSKNLSGSLHRRQAAEISAVAFSGATQSGKAGNSGPPGETDPIGDPGKLVARALAILAEEREAWQAERVSGRGNSP